MGRVEPSRGLGTTKDTDKPYICMLEMSVVSEEVFIRGVKYKSVVKGMLWHD
ncbi:predicted protein [Histoplasma mississippiense (nom. inval.)]|uniref:predicted protein n=1 Tax=Ajellomyces capsulatus (strain NAm1 / WU24) TaxID=2059318 RepID=UPI000157B4D8|nr:predicted protein [Histoplasma mississippiense (nom. inval.)]EDN03049.1 predicted protein [Histoplasma mississippiense (nom. inval.)]